MTIEELQTLSATASRCATQLRLPLQAKVWKGQSGEFAGAGVGSSLDFQDHRHYAPGDDPRHINWQAYARTGQYTMKLYREEVRPVIDLIFDVSASMFFDPSKAARTIEIFYLLHESALRAGASLNSMMIAGDTVRSLKNEAVSSHHWFEEAQSMSKKRPSAFPQVDRLPLRGNAIRILLSDLLFPGNPEPLIRTLTSRKGSLLLFSPFLESEAKPDWDGNYDFIEVERGTRHSHRIEPKLLARYQASYQNHFSIWHAAAVRHQVKLARIPSAPDLFQSLLLDALACGALETAS